MMTRLQASQPKGKLGDDEDGWSTLEERSHLEIYIDHLVEYSDIGIPLPHDLVCIAAIKR